MWKVVARESVMYLTEWQMREQVRYFKAAGIPFTIERGWAS